MTKIRTEISIEFSERLTIRRKRFSIRGWCDDCKRTSIMVLPTEAAFLSCLDVDSIVTLMYSSELHVRQFKEKGLYICMTSLCLYPFEKDFEDAGLEIEDEETIKVFDEVKTSHLEY